MADPIDLGERGLEALGLPPEVTRVLASIRAEVNAAYRESFIEMQKVMREQASALARIQGTLQILVETLQPILEDKLQGEMPAAFSIAASSDEADVAKALVVADPIGMGFTLSQADLARALDLPQPYVSKLVKAFKLADDPQCAVQVRRGKGRGTRLVNYHPAAIAQFVDLVLSPPSGLTEDQLNTVRRVKDKLDDDLLL